MQPHIPHPQEFYRGNVNITESDGTLVLPPLPKGHTFVVTSSLIQMLTARDLFSRLPFEDLHAHISKLGSVCKSCLGRPDLDMSVFPHISPGEAAIWFTEFSYNSIYIWDQLRDVFLAKYYLASKKLNKDKVNNFVALHRESISSTYDKFTAY